MSTKSDNAAKYFDQHTESFDGIYSGKKSLPLRWWDRMTRKNIIQRFDYTMAALAPLEGKSILDAGCGTGRYCFRYAQLGAAYVHGVDISEKMIGFANLKKSENTLYDKCYFEKSNILDAKGHYDAISALGFFDYIEEPGEVLRHLRKMTRGKLICSFPARMSFRYPFRKIWFMLHHTPVMFYSKHEIVKLLRESNFKIDEIKKTGPIYIVSASV